MGKMTHQEWLEHFEGYENMSPEERQYKTETAFDVMNEK